MLLTKVRNYTDTQLLERAEYFGLRIPNIGEKYLIIGVQSQEDDYNLFDDKFYVFDGCDFKMVSSGTTNPGSTALKRYDRYGLNGAAVWRTNMAYENLYYPGYHKKYNRFGGMKALRQVEPIFFYRDSDKDNKSEEKGVLYEDIIYANMHGVDYDPFSEITKEQIGGWSFGCQVWNNMSDYRNMIKATWKRKKHVDYVLLKEF